MASMIDKAMEVPYEGKAKVTTSGGDIKIAGQKVHGTGYGLMGLTWRSNPPPQEQAFAAMSKCSSH